MNLKTGEALYLEGAEDFDVVGTSSATAVQTRATAAKISLRSDVVVESLVNFWNLSLRHPEKVISFHYLTTSAAAEEDKSPFGAGVKGLELWQNCVASGDLTLADQLRLFLIEDKSVRAKMAPPPLKRGELRDETLRDFLDTAPVEEVFRKIIARVKWDLQSDDSEVVRESVAMRINAHGQALGMRPVDCAPALDRLYRIAATTAGQDGPRLLTREDFQREFDDATQRLLSPADRVIQKSAADLLHEAISGGRELRDILLESAASVQVGVPELGAPVVERPALVTKLTQTTNKEGVLVLQGSSGMGKTKCARLVARKIGGDWVWADFQGVKSTSLPALVRLLAANLGQESNRNVALDNLNYSGADLQAVDTQLAAIVRLTRHRGGKVIITTQRELSARTMQKLKLTAENTHRTPRLTETEIEEFCELLGCPADAKGNQSKVVWLLTSGHPQLVHARLAVLAQKQWPKPTAADLARKVQEIDEEKEVARQLLDHAPAGDKELLFRLSLASGPFRRDHAIAIAQVTLALDYGADAFSRLTGPWIETVGAGYFRLSPLLAGAALENWPADRIRTMRGGIARAFLACPEKTLREADEVLTQGFAAEDVEAIAAVAANLAYSPIQSREVVADVFFWLPAIGRQPGMRAVKGNAFVNLLIRLAQFKIAGSRDRQEANDLCSLADREYAEDMANPLAGLEPTKERLIWLTSVLFEYTANVAPSTLVRYWQETLELVPGDETFTALAGSQQEQAQGIPHLGGTDFPAHLLMLITARSMVPAELVDFANAINALPASRRDQALQGLKAMPFPLRLAVDRAWSNEVPKPGTDWGAVVGALESFQSAVTAWGIPVLDVFIRRAIAAVEDEYRNNPARAEEILAAGTTAEDAARLLKDQRAIVHYRKQEHAKAVAIWREIIPGWPVEKRSPDSIPLYACQRSANSAGRLKDWPQVIAFCLRGQELAGILDEDHHYAVTFLADEAFAQWKSGNRVGALTKLRLALEGFEKLADDRDQPLRLHGARKMFEQVIKWCRSEVGIREDETYEPPAGVCSRIDFDEDIKNYPTAPLDLIWYYLSDIESGVHSDRTVFRTAEARIPTSKYAAFRSVMSGAVLKESIRTLDLTHLISRAVTLVHSIEDTKAQGASGKTMVEQDAFPKFLQSDPSWITPQAAICGMIALASTGHPLDEFFAAWEADAKSFVRFPGVVISLAEVRRTLGVPATEAAALYQKGGQPDGVRFTAALRMSADNAFDLNEMFLGHAALFNYCSRIAHMSGVEGLFGEFIRKRWQERLRFAAVFPSPRLTIPPIKAACDDPSTGLRLVARILLAARSAVPVNPPTEIVDAWQKAVQ